MSQQIIWYPYVTKSIDIKEKDIICTKKHQKGHICKKKHIFFIIKKITRANSSKTNLIELDSTNKYALFQWKIKKN